MKLETHVKRIMAMNCTEELKAVKLDTLALKAVPGSIKQKQIIRLSNEIKERNGGHTAVYERFCSHSIKTKQRSMGGI